MNQIMKADDLRQPFLFIHSFFIIPVILSSDSLILLIITVFYLLLNIFFKQKISLLRLFLFTGAIVILNLSIPNGRVFLRILHFPVTTGALVKGIYKALLFDSLILVSNFSLAQPVALHGPIGLMIQNSLEFMNQMFQSIQKKSKKVDFFKYVDNLLLNLWDNHRAMNTNKIFRLNFAFLFYFYIIILVWIVCFVSKISLFF
ncbi:MAG: hypothetical protein JXR70_00760 [Spirochaetales bacterium]|nr:hypothetical protein [Spirochaetales bacterium]